MGGVKSVPNNPVSLGAIGFHPRKSGKYALKGLFQWNSSNGAYGPVVEP